MRRQILNSYIISRTALSIAIVLLSIGGLLLVMGFADEVSRRVSDTYAPLDALLYKVYTVPAEVYEFIGPIVMLGTLIAVGGMGKSSELVIIQLASRSAAGLVFRLILPGLILLPLVYAFGEWAAPQLKVQAEITRSEKRNIGLPTLEGQWYRDGPWVINADFIAPDRSIRGLTIFELNADNRLASVMFGTVAEPIEDGWQLQEAREVHFDEDQVRHTASASKTWTPANFNPELLGILSQKPDKLTLNQLHRQVEFANQQNLSRDELDLLYWNRVWLPIQYLAMMFLALCFSFGSFRQRTLGDMAFRATAVAIATQLIIDTLGSAGLVLGLMPSLAALIPHLVFLGIVTGQLKRRL